MLHRGTHRKALFSANHGGVLFLSSLVFCIVPVLPFFPRLCLFLLLLFEGQPSRAVRAFEPFCPSPPSRCER